MNLGKAIWDANYLHCDGRSCVVDAHTFGPLCQGWEGLVLIAYPQVKTVILRIRQAMRDRLTGRGRPMVPSARGDGEGGGAVIVPLGPSCHPRSLGRAQQLSCRRCGRIWEG